MKYLIFYVILLFSISCSKRTNQDKILYAPNNSIKIENYLEFHDYLILKNKPLSNINKIINNKNKLYVLDLAHGSRGQLVVFDNKGQYLYNISQSGKGPGEYIELRDFTIKNDTIVLMDGMTDDILLYANDTVFVDKIHLPVELCSGIITTNDGFILHRPLYHDENPEGLHAITILDSSLNITRQQYAYDKQSKTINFTNALQECGNNIVFAQMFTDAIYVFNKYANNTDVYDFDFGLHSIMNINSNEYSNILHNNSQYIYFISAPILINDKLIGHIADLGKKRLFIFDITSEKFVIDNDNFIPICSAWISYFNEKQIVFDITNIDKNSICNYPKLVKDAVNSEQTILAIYNIIN